MKELKKRSHHDNYKKTKKKNKKKTLKYWLTLFLLAAFQKEFYLGWGLGVVGFQALPPCETLHNKK